MHNYRSRIPQFWVSAALMISSGFFILASLPIHAQELPSGCGSLRMQGRFGPYDYRASGYIPETTYRSHQALLGIVENRHFTPEVEALIRGSTNTTPGRDIAYTLHAFPNHHRALIAIDALSQKENTTKPFGTNYDIECWFSRATAWRPDDAIVRMIYASFLVRSKRFKDAERQLDVATDLAGDNAFTYNNIGLIYFDMRNYEKALSHAHKSYELGLRIPTLQDALKSVGKWTDPIEPTTNQPKIADQPTTSPN